MIKTVNGIYQGFVSCSWAQSQEYNDDNDDNEGFASRAALPVAERVEVYAATTSSTSFSSWTPDYMSPFTKQTSLTVPTLYFCW